MAVYTKYYDRDGKPMLSDAFMTKFEDPSYKRVARGEIDTGGQHVEVSTVWLGIDHNFGFGAPLIFETMVFGGAYDQECVRYHTEKEALAGHRRTMIDLASGDAPWFMGEDY